MLSISNCYAQITPDAGALQQQIEQQLPQVLPEEGKPFIAPPSEYKPASGLTITVKQFRFVGNKQLTAEQLAPAVASFLNRPLDFSELQQATAAVGVAYHEAGWLVRVYLPQQDVSEGIITIQIVEAVFGKVRYEGEAVNRLTASRADAYIAAAQQSGKSLNAATLDRALFMLDDLPGVAVSGNLAPGAGEAETDLILKLADESLFSGEVGLDNTGSRSTGEPRVTANTFLKSPLKIGDQFATNHIHSEGSGYARLAYSLPVGYDGLRLGMNASYMDYKVITPEFSSANIYGNSTSLGLDAQHSLVRARTHNLYLLAAYDNKAFDNKANGATSTNYHVSSFSVGMIGNLFDKLGGGGANMASLHFTSGKVDLSGSPNKAFDARTTQTDGNYTKLRYALSRQQALTSELSFYALLTGQLASKNLDSSEKFFLGGANGVRAYPSNEGSGSEGAMLNLELRWRARPNWLITGFYDWGNVTVNKNNSYTGAPTLNAYALDGMGVSLAWSGPMGITLKGTYATRLGDNPNRDTTTGNDQDGSYNKQRLWLVASIPFSFGSERAATKRVEPASEVQAVSPAEVNLID